MKNGYFIQLNTIRTAVADLVDYDDTTKLITRINVPKEYRSTGVGSQLLQQIVHDADEEGITLLLEIVPSDGLNFQQLELWYKRYGFKKEDGMYRRAPNPCHLEIWSVRYSMQECDGCGKTLPVGSLMIANIDSCCGGGCSRALCFDCIKKAYEMIGGLS